MSSILCILQHNFLLFVRQWNASQLSISEENFRISNLKNRLLAGLKEQIDTLWVNGGSETLPNIISVGFSDIDASNLLSLMQTKLAASKKLVNRIFYLKGYSSYAANENTMTANQKQLAPSLTMPNFLRGRLLWGVSGQ